MSEFSGYRKPGLITQGWRGLFGESGESVKARMEAHAAEKARINAERDRRLLELVQNEGAALNKQGIERSAADLELEVKRGTELLPIQKQQLEQRAGAQNMVIEPQLQYMRDADKMRLIQNLILGGGALLLD